MLQISIHYNTGKVVETSNSEWGDMSKRGKVFKQGEKNV